MGRWNRGWGNFKKIPSTSFQSAAFLNDKTYIDIYNRMEELALNLFEYDNLPIECNIRYLELMLYTYGYSFFFKDDVADLYVNLSGTLDGCYDIYGECSSYTALSFNGNYRYSLDATNSVIIYNNFTRIPTKDQVTLFAWRAWNALRTADTNLEQQKTTKMLKVPNQRRLTLENILMKVRGNEIYALVADDMDVESCVVDLTVPYIADKAINAYNAIWNEYLTFLGIVNHNSDKKEREVQIEVMGHMGQTEMSRTTMLRSRRIGFEKVNRMFGLDVQVRFNSDLANFFLENKIDYDWGDGSVNLHNNDKTDSGIAQHGRSTDITED